MQHTLSDTEKASVVQAIKSAEHQTSGEIRVHIEAHCEAPMVLDRAIEVFGHLGMHKTEKQNGVLFYVAVKDRKFAIVGDKGINTVVPTDFWKSTQDIMRNYLSDNQLVEGLSKGIEEVGKQLKAYFPYQSDDKNELPDEISFG
jgi:uncharacterized membrane protein